MLKLPTVIQLLGLVIIFAFQVSCVDQPAKPNQKSSRSIGQEGSILVNSLTDSTKQLPFTSPVCVIFQDSKNQYWFGSKKEGVCKYDGTNFTYFTTADGLSSYEIRSIQEDHAGTIWINTAYGVSSYDGKDITNQTPNGIASIDETWSKNETDLWFDPGNRSGILRYDGQKISYLEFPPQAVINPNNVYHTTCMSDGKDNMLWIGTYAGVVGYDGSNFTMINDETIAFKKNKTDLLHIRSILEDSKGRLWIGNNGIGVLLKDGKTIINFSDQQNLIHPTSTRAGGKSKAGTLEHVFAIEEDINGNIWFGDRDTGAWKYDGKTMTNFTMNDGLTDNFVVSIYSDDAGKVWVGQADGNVFTFNGEGFDQQFSSPY